MICIVFQLLNWFPKFYSFQSIVQENDPFILRIALTIMKRINTKESRTYIEKLVNATADHVVVKMGADHGIKRFHKRLLTAVLQVSLVNCVRSTIHNARSVTLGYIFREIVPCLQNEVV